MISHASKVLRRAPLGFAFGSAQYRSGGAYGPIPNPYLTLLLIKTGKAIVTSDGMMVHLSAGDCALFHNRDSILFEYQRGIFTDVAWLECEPSVGTPTETGGDRLLSRPLVASERIRTLIQLGVELGGDSTVHRNRLRNTIGEAALDSFVFEATEGLRDLPVPPAARVAHQFIQAHFLDDIDLKEIAASARVTPEHLVVSFRKAFGVTPIRFVWQLRARAAAVELSNTHDAIAEIAWRCRYRSPYHFSRHIKQTFGLPHSQLRSRHGFQSGSDDTPDAAMVHF